MIKKHIHPARVISILVLLFHSTNVGQYTIFYNNLDNQYIKEKIAPLSGNYLSAAIDETGKIGINIIMM